MVAQQHPFHGTLDFAAPMGRGLPAASGVAPSSAELLAQGRLVAERAIAKEDLMHRGLLVEGPQERLPGPPLPAEPAGPEARMHGMQAAMNPMQAHLHQQHGSVHHVAAMEPLAMGPLHAANPYEEQQLHFPEAEQAYDAMEYDGQHAAGLEHASNPYVTHVFNDRAPNPYANDAYAEGAPVPSIHPHSLR